MEPISRSRLPANLKRWVTFCDGLGLKIIGNSTEKTQEEEYTVGMEKFDPFPPYTPAPFPGTEYATLLAAKLAWLNKRIQEANDLIAVEERLQNSPDQLTSETADEMIKNYKKIKDEAQTDLTDLGNPALHRGVLTRNIREWLKAIDEDIKISKDTAEMAQKEIEQYGKNAPSAPIVKKRAEAAVDRANRERDNLEKDARTAGLL